MKTILAILLLTVTIFADGHRMSTHDPRLSNTYMQEELYWSVGLYNEASFISYESVLDSQSVASNDLGDFDSKTVNKFLETDLTPVYQSGLHLELHYNDLGFRVIYAANNYLENLSGVEGDRGAHLPDLPEKEDKSNIFEFAVQRGAFEAYHYRSKFSFGTAKVWERQDNGMLEVERTFNFNMLLNKTGAKLAISVDKNRVNYLLFERKELSVPRMLHISDTRSGTKKIVASLGPFTGWSDMWLVGYARESRPQGKIYWAPDYAIMVGAGKSAIRDVKDVDIDGYYLKNEAFDIGMDIRTALTLGMNFRNRWFDTELFTTAYLNAALQLPMIDLMPVGYVYSDDEATKDKEKRDLRGNFSEQYGTYEVNYGIIAQARVTF